MKTVIGILVVLSLATCPGAFAQYIFLDADSDGILTDADELSPTTTWVDVWLWTDRDHRGTPTSIVDKAGKTPTINSYEFILRVSNGSITWGEYTNLQLTMTVPFGPRKNESEFYHGFGGPHNLAPGKYKLGRLAINEIRGEPRLEFAPRTSLWGVARTSFGSRAPGRDGDHTLKFGESEPATGYSPGRGADWTDAGGLPARGLTTSTIGATQGAESALRYTVGTSPLPWRGPGQIYVHTTRTGHVRVQLFEVSGRLVRTLADEPAMSPGAHTFRVDARSAGHSAIAPGVYFYRVEASEGTKRGRIVIIKK